MQKVVSKNVAKNKVLNMFIYTESDTEPHRNTQNINIYIYISQNTKYTKLHLLFHNFQDSIFKKSTFNKSVFYGYGSINIWYIGICVYILYVKGHTA